MTIADDLSALSGHILLIALVINPVLISWLDLQLGFPLSYLLHFKKFEFELIHSALSTLFYASSPSDCWPVSLWACIPILAYILGKLKQ